MQTIVYLSRHLGFLAGEVRPAYGTDKQGIAGNHEPGRLATAPVGNEQADGIRRMAGGMDNVDAHIAHLDALTVFQRFDCELRLALNALVQTIGRAEAFSQCPAARVMVGMNMGIDYVGDGHIPALGLLDEPVLITRHHIHCHGFAFAATAEQIRRARHF